jgi:hypothetical protein
MPTADEIEVSDFVRGYSSINLERITFSWNGNDCAGLKVIHPPV